MHCFCKFFLNLIRFWTKLRMQVLCFPGFMENCITQTPIPSNCQILDTFRPFFLGLLHPLFCGRNWGYHDFLHFLRESYSQKTLFKWVCGFWDCFGNTPVALNICHLASLFARVCHSSKKCGLLGCFATPILTSLTLDICHLAHLAFFPISTSIFPFPSLHSCPKTHTT